MFPLLSTTMFQSDKLNDTAENVLTALLGNPDVASAIVATGAVLAIVAVLAIGFVAFIFNLYFHWRICSKAGYSGALALLMLLPIIGSILLLLILTFAKWPLIKQSGK